MTAEVRCQRSPVRAHVLSTSFLDHLVPWLLVKWFSWLLVKCFSMEFLWSISEIVSSKFLSVTVLVPMVPGSVLTTEQ